LITIVAEEVRLLKDREACVVCGRRSASWSVDVENDGTIEKRPMCAWCVMYSNESVWGQGNKVELAEVGMAAQETALKVKRPPPRLDELRRLSPEDAEKFMLGVVMTSNMIRRML